MGSPELTKMADGPGSRKTVLLRSWIGQAGAVGGHA